MEDKIIISSDNPLLEKIAIEFDNNPTNALKPASMILEIILITLVLTTTVSRLFFIITPLI